jgi:Putative restriction endonuclease
MNPGIYRLSPRQFRKAIKAGVIGERRVELLGGIPFIMADNPPYIFASIRIGLALGALAAGPRWVVNKDHHLELGQWLPLPDAVVLKGPDTIYGTRLARADDVALLVEIADTSYLKDSGPKLRRYASFRIPVDWIVDRNRRLVEVHSQPFGTGKHAGYARCDSYFERDYIPVVLAGNEVGQIAVADLMP